MKPASSSLTLNSQASPISLNDSQFTALASVPAELEWFANIDNPQTRRAYKADIGDFQAFTGIQAPEQFRLVARAHVLAWRKSLEKRLCSPATLRRKLAALSSLFEYLCERNCVVTNPVKGVKRPRVESNEGKTPALSDAQARQLLAAPDVATLKGKRDRAILAVLLYHGLRRAELCALNRRDIEQRRGVNHLRVQGKGAKIRYVPLHPLAAAAIQDYVDGVGELVSIGTERGRSVKPSLKIGICGEHGGDPRSVAFCHEIGLDYVSCSPFRVPVARLAAAQAAIQKGMSARDKD